jgi:hypothetical protein
MLAIIGIGAAQEIGLPPDVRAQVDTILVIQDDNNALDLVRALIGDSPEHKIEIAEAAAGLRPDLADLIMAMLVDIRTASTDFPACPPRQTGEAFLDCLPDQPVKKAPARISTVLLDTLENPNFVSPSR